MKSSSSYLKVFNKLEKANEVHKNEIAYEFPYELDNFQKQGIYGIHNNENVLITAHTGSGKTVLAIYAIANALKNNKKCIYTSPTKSLSNQKYSEFKEKFESVGIFTGDIKMNPDAQCIIMTTEILRNILYKENNTQQSSSKLLNIDINEIGAVIFDEVHYINDPDRGKVWEESIVLLPPEITLVMLSATIDKPEEFSSWIGDIKQKPIHLIPTSHRVVPLKHYYWKGTQFINNNGKDEVSWSMIEILSASGEFKNYNVMNNKFKVYDVNKIMDKLVDYLVDEKYTPALFFKFSRRKCEELCRMVRRSLLTFEEMSEIEKIFSFQMRNYKKIYEILPQYQSVYDQLLKGVVYHHSGLIPILKEIIEILYSKGLIKILFATETFSIGVNMPTKTVLFTDLDKYDNKGKRFLRSDEYLQMSGRAGRRGLDEFGSVILLPTFDLLSEIELKSIMIGKSPSVKSKFNLSYQFVLKSMLLETKNINDIISNTLIRNEYKKMSNGLQKRNEEIEILLEKYDFNEDELKVLKRYDDIYNKMNSTIFTLKKKDYQKLELEKKNIEMEKDFQNSYKRYQEYTTLLKEFDNNNNSIDHNETDILKQIDVIKSVLKEYDYIKDDNTLTKDDNTLTKDDNTLTKKGIIASAVNDCNELLFTEMIFQGYLDNLTFPEIIGLLSTFINEKDGEDKYLNDLDITDNLYDVLKKLQKLSIKLEDNESNKGLFLKMDYNLYLDFIEPAYIWASGGSIQEIYSVTAIYDGNFVKAIMRINNICDNLMDICKTIERYDICAKLENSTSILIRDITTINSLYVN